MERILYFPDKYHQIIEFQDILNQTKQTFYRENNDFCIFSKFSENEVFLLTTKKNSKENNNTKVVAKLNLEKKSVETTPCVAPANIISLTYFDKTKTLIAGADDQFMYLYNSDSMKFFQKVSVGKGLVSSLFISDNTLYVGSNSFISVYGFQSSCPKDKSYEIELLSHFKIETNTQPNHYTTIVKDKKKTVYESEVITPTKSRC
jgi:hypothetical protein